MNGVISRIAVDSLDYDLGIGEDLLRFEKFYSDLPELSNSIRSIDLRRLAKKLIKVNTPITYIGKAWSGNTADWIYLDKVLDIKGLRKELSFGENIIDHKNLDNKSGLENGFIDKGTGEGVMGKLE